MLREAGLLTDDEKVSDLFHDSEQVKPLAGEVATTIITEDEIHSIKKKTLQLHFRKSVILEEEELDVSLSKVCS